MATDLHLVAEVVSVSAGMSLMRTMPLALVNRTPPSKSSRFSKVRAPPTKGWVSGAHCPAASWYTDKSEARTKLATTAAISGEPLVVLQYEERARGGELEEGPRWQFGTPSVPGRVCLRLTTDPTATCLTITRPANACLLSAGCEKLGQQIAVGPLLRRTVVACAKRRLYVSVSLSAPSCHHR